jgi:hypothetical protein
MAPLSKCVGQYTIAMDLRFYVRLRTESPHGGGKALVWFHCSRSEWRMKE